MTPLILYILAAAIVLTSTRLPLVGVSSFTSGRFSIVLIRAKGLEKTAMAMTVLGVSLLLGTFIGGIVGIYFGIQSGAAGYLGGAFAGFIIALPFEYFLLRYFGRATKTAQIG